MGRSSGRVVVLTIPVLCLVLCLVGCAGWKKYGKLEKSARESYVRGDYDQAVYTCTQALRINPDYDKAKVLIQDAFTAARADHEGRVGDLKSSSEKFNWDLIVDHYEKLIDLNENMRTLPRIMDKDSKQQIVFDLKDYGSALAEAREAAAEDHYDLGLRLSLDENADGQKHAAKEFKAAESFVPGYKDAESRYSDCRRAAIKRVAVFLFENKTGERRYDTLCETITDNIISNVMHDQSVMEFLEIVSREQLGEIIDEQKLGVTGVIDQETAVELGKVLGVQEIAVGQVTQVIHRPERVDRKTERETRRAVVRTETYVDGKGKKRERDVYGDVHADVTYYTKTAGASVSGSYKIIEVKTARIKSSESITGTYEFEHAYARYSGDKRALSGDALVLISENEGIVPTREEMIVLAGQDLSDSLAGSLKAYAR